VDLPHPSSNTLTELTLNVPLDTKQVILGMLFLANLLASTEKNKSSPKSFGKSTLLRLTAENAHVCRICQLCNVHCRQVQLISHGYATSIPHQSLDTSVPNPRPTYCINPTTTTEDVGLIVHAISFQFFQPMWSWSTNVTDRWTDRQTDDMRSQDRALHHSASHSKNQV